MIERTIREGGAATYLSGYWLSGQRHQLCDHSIGWHVATWSNNEPLIEYWVANGTFYSALSRWISEDIFDVEIFMELTEADQLRRSLIPEAIKKWEMRSGASA